MRSAGTVKLLVWATAALLLLLAPHLKFCSVEAAFSTQLYGDGTSSAKAIFTAWAERYSYVRDDVSISYTGSGTLIALDAYARQAYLDFVGTDRGVTGDLLAQYGNLVQFPLYGQALVISYNVVGLNTSVDGNLVLDRETLGLIWAGEITQWDDQRIKDLNTPALAAKLPSAVITLGYKIDSEITVTEVFKVALASFSDTFRTALAAANNSFALMPPALAGHAVATGSSLARGTWAKNTPNSMTFLSLSDTITSGLPWVNMINKAGQKVIPSVYSVQAAMAQFSANYSAGNFTIDIVDAPGAESWPLAYTTFVAINRSITALDCTNIEELMRFIAWTQINDAASTLAISNGFVPIDVSLRKNILDLFTRITCNGVRALDTSYLIGAGPPLPVYIAWAVAQSTNDATIKYFEATSLQAKKQLLTFDEQFGATSNGLEDEWYQAIPDVALMPAVVYALTPTYNVRALDGLNLVLNFETIAAIYMANITQWDDPRIKAINTPAVASLLPAKPIIVVTQTTSSDITLLFSAMLSATVPSFADKVGSGDVLTFPVQSETNNSIEVSNYSTLASTMAATANSFSFLNLYEAVLTPTVNYADMNNSAGVVVRASAETVQSALSDYLTSNANPTFSGIVLSPSAGSWPLVTFGSYIYRSTTMEDCAKAEALASFFYYTQSDAEATRTADRQGFIQASRDAKLQSRFLNQLKKFTCNGAPASNLYNCISDGRLCSDAGVCTDNECICDSGREGQYCEGFVSASSSSDASTIAIAVIIPVAAIILLVLVCLILALVAWIKRRGNKSDDWEIEYAELEVGEQLGAGGYGEVHKALWKGTEVAVKVIAAEKITKEMEKSFHDEVRVMTSLRHPNVVLFMAASTKPPKMCIVMEFMALGSLFDLLHNELIPEIPFALKAKMAYQASKGMHFLHSSGIVHRDLKSLNLLLDNKWNVKVSDFGLTKFKEDVKKGGSQNIAGSVHWTAPEVLDESAEVDFILADVYSFGVILWELLTREQPYFGLSPAAVAVAVLRDGIRPQMPDQVSSSCPQEYEDLITSCWHSDPVIRPTFLEIMTRLSSMHGESTSGGGVSFTSKTSSSSSSGNSGGERKPPKTNIYNSWTLPSTNGSATSTGSSSSSNASRNFSAVAQAAAGGVRAPEGEVAIVFTDITRAASLWEFNAAAMRDATLLHNECLRAALKKHRGYEVVFLRDRNSGEGSFCMAFQQVADALAWCCDVQQALLKVEWPEALLDHPGAAEEWGDTDDRIVYKGLRVRMGVHVGTPKVVRDPMTRRVEYIGPVVNAAARITAMTHGGQIVMSHSAHDKIVSAEDASGFDNRMVSLGKFEMADVPHGARLYELKVEGLEGRFFGGVTKDGETTSSSGAPTSSGVMSDGDGNKLERRGGDGSATSGSGGMGSSDDNANMQTAVGEGMMFKEDTFLTSANLCRWIIDFGEIALGKQIGLGSYGVVFRGKWKGVEVAVKRFIKQKLDERRMLEFRAEMAFLSELHHPNIVLFIGACVKKPNLCIVTEFMKQGSLKDILSNNAIKLAWKQKLRLLRSAALGINYLHSLHPVIVHRDLKPSNLLVDENWNVKVADFGFARIKEENATMTRCGTPCWTAPEIIRGDKYDERADVFSFGVVMWQVVTRREPYAGRNFMGVSLDVLEGKRPQIPGDCPPDFRKVMKKCWHANPDKRPKMDDVVSFLDQQVGDEDGSIINP